MGLSGGAIAGIVVGSVVAVLMFCVVCTRMWVGSVERQLDGDVQEGVRLLDRFASDDPTIRTEYSAVRDNLKALIASLRRLYGSLESAA